MPQESTKDLIARIERMSSEFNVKSAEEGKVARMLQSVAQALRDAQNKNQELQRQLDVLKKDNLQEAPPMPRKDGLIEGMVKGVGAVKALIAAGADLNERAYAEHITPLMLAAQFGRREIVELLINRGADIHAKTKGGMPALDYAKKHLELLGVSRSGGGYKDSNALKIIELLEQAAAKQPVPPAEKPDVVINGKPYTAMIAGKPLTVLIDGSGSMGSSYAGPQAPLQRALDATLALAGAGKNVSAVLWGDQTPVPVEVTKEGFEKAAKGLSCETDFSPAVEYMKAAAQSRNFVVLSDGDLLDKENALVKTRELLSTNPHATLDFVIICDRKDVSMAQLATTLRGEYPRQVTLSTMKKHHDVAAALTSIAAFRGINESRKLLPKQKSGKPGLQ